MPPKKPTNNPVSLLEDDTQGFRKSLDFLSKQQLNYGDDEINENKQLKDMVKGKGMILSLNEEWKI